MDDKSSATQHTGTGHLSRRTLLKTAGHAAWAVPAIQVVSMAPAFAATSDSLQITGASGQWTLNAAPTDDSMTASITVQNDSTTDTTVGLQLTVTFPPFYFRGGNTLTISGVTGAWSAGSVDQSGSVTFTATTEVGPNGAFSTLGFTATTTRNIRPGKASGDNDTVSVQATAMDAQNNPFQGASTTFDPAYP